MTSYSTIYALRAKYHNKAYDPEDLFLLRGDDALIYLNEAITSGFKLLGVDGFWMHKGGAIQPDQEFSNDIANWHGERADFVETTKELIRRGSTQGVWFEFVFTSDYLR